MSVSILQSISHVNSLSTGGTFSTGSLTPGSFIVVALIPSNTSTSGTCSDNLNGAYTPAVFQSVAGGVPGVRLLYALNTHSGAVTVTYGGMTNQSGGVLFAELSAPGLTTLDTTAVGTNGGVGTVSVTSGLFTTAQPHELLIACGTENGSSSAYTSITNYTTAVNAAMALTWSGILGFKEVQTIQSGATATANFPSTIKQSIVVATFVLPNPVTTNWLSGQREFINKHNR